MQFYLQSAEYLGILQKVVETLQMQERRNGAERECYLLSLFTRLEVLLEKSDISHQRSKHARRHLDVIKRLSEAVLREKDPVKAAMLLSIINSPF
ncbi:uncharacterized protein NEMAJ01_1432 [Nematocida major]|uniref:uncharacterized protein n=1 Tax=Nematocida major TaxID=1912982 RepID=UPI002007BE07|nr:uncharacterized protein NEMAJ01_1432 [Nematocida major]KAH9386536.1 hypothetical protein NEMAJ01_1432 [Nematocida major]